MFCLDEEGVWPSQRPKVKVSVIDANVGAVETCAEDWEDEEEGVEFGWLKPCQPHNGAVRQLGFGRRACSRKDRLWYLKEQR